MTELLTITGTPGAGAVPPGAPYSRAEEAVLPSLNPASKAPSHCGTPMTWAAPGLNAMSAHTFGAGGGHMELPPVWRCSCGFQLDGVVHTSNALASLS